MKANAKHFLQAVSLMVWVLFSPLLILVIVMVYSSPAVGRFLQEAPVKVSLLLGGDAEPELQAIS